MYRLGLGLLLFCLIFNACKRSEYNDSPKAIDSQNKADAFMDIVKKVPQLQDSYKVANFQTRFYIRDNFLKPFKHIRNEQGYILDYVQVFSDLVGGGPVLYSHKISEDGFLTCKGYEDFVTLKYPEVKSIHSIKNPYNYINHIFIDDTEDGYFEYIVFLILNHQFNLSWHGGYNDYKIICTKSKLKDVLKGINNLPNLTKNNALKLNIEPKVELKENEALVYICVFTEWGGLIKRKYIIPRKRPYIDNDYVEIDTLVKYNCGIMY